MNTMNRLLQVLYTKNLDYKYNVQCILFCLDDCVFSVHGGLLVKAIAGNLSVSL